jgi:formyl-CoA transferase
MVDAVLAVCERMVFQYSASAQAPGPEGNGHPLLCPFGLFPASDGFISLGVPNDRFWRLLVKRMGNPPWAGDARFATNELRVRHRAEVEQAVAGWAVRCRSDRCSMPQTSSTIRISASAGCWSKPSSPARRAG